MPRHRRCRRAFFYPHTTIFKPAGIPASNLMQIIIYSDEFEAVRLKDFEELDQVSCAVKMNISQPTFHRLIKSARKKLADAIINGKAINISKFDARVNYFVDK